MLRSELLKIFESGYVSGDEKKEIGKKAGYSGADGGIQGVKKYLSAETIDTDDKNICDVFLKVLGYGKLRYLCYACKVKLEYNDYINFYMQDIKEIEDNLNKMSFEDVNMILRALDQVVKKYKI